MKILYIIDQNITKENREGIINKIYNQITYWKNNGVEVDVLSMYSFTIYDSELRLKDDKKSYKLRKHNKYFTLFRYFYSTLKLLACNFLDDYYLIYLRARPYMPFTRRALRNKKIIIEINTHDILEWKLVNKPMYFYNLLTRNLFYSLANAFVAMSDELKNVYKDFNKESIVISNSIDVSAIEFVEKTNNKTANIVFLGSPGYAWNGVEKILDLSKKLKQYNFHIIGYNGESTDNLRYHGYLPLEKVNKILSKCDVAFGTLSLYEKGYNKTSTIKTTQYLANGLPIIYGYEESGFDNNQPYLLQLPNTPDNVNSNISKIKDFIEFCFKNNELRRAARKYAEQNLDITVREKKRLEFIRKVYEEKA